MTFEPSTTFTSHCFSTHTRDFFKHWSILIIIWIWVYKCDFAALLKVEYVGINVVYCWRLYVFGLGRSSSFVEMKASLSAIWIWSSNTWEYIFWVILFYYDTVLYKGYQRIRFWRPRLRTVWPFVSKSS